MLKFALSLIKNDPLPNITDTDNALQTALNIVFVIVGAVAFLMLVIAGFRYIIYGSDPNKLSEVKRQIFHIIIGLIIVALSAAIVNFILNRVA